MATPITLSPVLIGECQASLLIDNYRSCECMVDFVKLNKVEQRENR